MNENKEVIRKAISSTVTNWFDTTIAAAAARLERGAKASDDPKGPEDRSWLMFPFVNGGY